MIETFTSPSFAISLGYILITAGVMRLSRLILTKFSGSSYTTSLGLEFCATFELIATVFELGIVLQRHGFAPFGILLMIMFNYWGHTWESASPAPHPRIIEILLRKTPWKIAVHKILAQVLAAGLVYTIYVKPIWSLGYRQTHLARVGATGCVTAVKVPIALGFLAEASATLLFMVAGKLLRTRKYSYLTIPGILVALKYIGLSYTGSFMNPVLASAVQFGCQGISGANHFLVYWLGPVVGSIAFILGSNLLEPGVEKTPKEKTGQKNNKKADKKTN